MTRTPESMKTFCTILCLNATSKHAPSVSGEKTVIEHDSCVEEELKENQCVIINVSASS
mgnify:CR=1 FL=1